MGKGGLRILCPKVLVSNEPQGIQWLIGSPFFPSFTLLSTFRCIHTLPSSHSSPDFNRESEDLRLLILKGFDVIGALIVEETGSNLEKVAARAVDASHKIRKLLHEDELEIETQVMIGAVAELGTDTIRFFLPKSGNSGGLDPISSVIYEDNPEKYICELGCLLRCKLPLKLPVCLPINNIVYADEIFSRAIKSVSDKFKGSQTVYIAEAFSNNQAEVPQSVVFHSMDLDFHTELSNVMLSHGSDQDPNLRSLSCSHFCSGSALDSSLIMENVGIIQVNVLLNRSSKLSKSEAPVAKYIPVSEETHILDSTYELEVLCFAAKDLPLTSAISKLVIPALVNQLNLMKKATLPNLLTQHPQFHSYHFRPPGILHPITVFYDLNYGETEPKQVEARRSLHLRLGLPLDRPLLRVANALSLLKTDDTITKSSVRKGSYLLKDVHVGIPSSGVSGGLTSLVQGSYEYYHYLQDGFDDSGWGCAYRSLQTIVSWFKIQHYTAIDVPSHREIQQSLVEIGDKDPFFIGSREWIGAIELSFVLDKLLGVTCKVMNVRSGAELPEKCRELALHFENQGTPIMIGGGVLAYTLLGVDYNEVSGDCGFLILDPHYTGSEDPKRISNGGWCGWKKAIDGKGKCFFLHDKFYNLLLPQRPNLI